MSDKTSLGDRIKSYENVTRTYLTPNVPVMIRVDGKSFHTFGKQLDKPFDDNFINAMKTSAIESAKTMQGFKVGFVASDEVTFVLTDYDTDLTQSWFGYNINKLVSISAAVMTVNFAQFYPNSLRVFDGRAFNIPKDDVINALLWRAKDWVRNSVAMVAHAHFSHKELHKKSISDMHEMLYNIGINWADNKNIYKNGTFFWKENSGIFHSSSIHSSFQTLNEMFGPLLEKRNDESN